MDIHSSLADYNNIYTSKVYSNLLYKSRNIYLTLVDTPNIPFIKS